MSSHSFGTSPFSRRSLIRRATAAGVGLMGLDLLAACGTSSTTTGTPNVTFTSDELPAASNLAQVRIYNNAVSAFQQAHKGVTITSLADPYDPKTYFTKAAAHTQEDCIDTYFTEPPLMIQRSTVADITSLAKSLPFYSSYAPSALDIVSKGGNVYGLPWSGYALGVMFSISAVKKAGIDPGTPPATWDDFRTYAAKIAATGIAGFVELTSQNTGGWHLTNWIYTGGGQLEDTSGSTAKAVFNNPAAVAWLKQLQAMRFTDKSLHNDVLVGYGDGLQIFATGKAGMVVEATDVLETLKTAYQMDLKDVGMWPMPQAPSSPGNAALSGGNLYVFKAGDSSDVLNAALQWVNYYRFDLNNFENNTAQAAAAGLPVGAPAAAIFTGSYQQQLLAISAKYANIPLANYTAYTNSKLALRPEPPIQTQAMYAALDPVVQAVLGSANADPATELGKAATAFQQTLDVAG